jgi:hypothetical protein
MIFLLSDLNLIVILEQQEKRFFSIDSHEEGVIDFDVEHQRIYVLHFLRG